jgi:phosphatidate cytidylyltransferase
MASLEGLYTKHFLLIALIVAVVSIFGDFVESFMKRVADIKDSGNFFPGHGGVLDRVLDMNNLRWTPCASALPWFTCT